MLTTSKFPEYKEKYNNQKADEKMECAMNLISSVRTIRSEMEISPKTPLELFYHGNLEAIDDTLTQIILELGKISNITYCEKTIEPKMSAIKVVGDVTSYVPLANIVDIDNFNNSVAKKAEKALNEQIKINNKINNPKYLSRAPQELINQDSKNLKEINLQVKTSKIKSNNLQVSHDKQQGLANALLHKAYNLKTSLMLLVKWIEQISY